MKKQLNVTNEIFYSPKRLAILISVSILLIEIIIMLILDLLPPLSNSFSAFIDAVILLAVLGPQFYFLVFRPIVRYSKKLKLKEEEILKFKHGIECSKDVIFMTNLNGEITYANASFEKVYGFSQEESIGKTPRILKSDLLSSESYSHFWTTLLDKKIVSGEIVNKTRNGQLVHIDGSNNPILDDKGNILGFLGVHRDTTDRKRTELKDRVRYEITKGVTTTSNLDELLQLIHASLGKVLYAENCFFALYNQDTHLFSFPFFKDKFDTVPPPVALKRSCTSYVFRTGKSVIITPRVFKQLYEQKEIELVGSPSPSWIGVPLKTSDKIIGVLVLQDYERENVYNERDLWFLDSIGSQVANVIERKRAQEKLEKSNSLLEATLESTADGILVVDKNGKTTNFNKRFIELWQIPKSILATNDNEQMLAFALNQLKDPEGFEKKVKELYENDTAISSDIIEFKDGRIFQWYSKPQIYEGKSFGRVWSFHDITDIKRVEKDLKQNEKKFRTFFEKSPIGIEIYDARGFLIDVNPAALEMFGLKEKSNTLGFNIFDGTSLNADIKTKLHSGDAVDYTTTFDFDKIKELHQYNSNRTGKADLHYSITPLKPESENSVVGYLLLVQDITERMRVEKELKENESRLLELNATKDKFFSIISHDLRSPFNGILGFSDLLVTKVKENDCEGIGKYAGIIQNSSHKAMNLLTNLLEWSRTQTNKMEFNPEYVEIVELVKEITELLNDSAKQKSIAILQELPRTAPFVADKAMLSTVIRNLVSNAIKFTNPGGKIKVSVEIQENNLLFSVADNGIGIDKKKLNDLFRIDKSTSTTGTKNEQGTGLGLLLCKEFIEKHGGKIWAESNVGKGSTFHFMLYPISI